MYHMNDARPTQEYNGCEKILASACSVRAGVGAGRRRARGAVAMTTRMSGCMYTLHIDLRTLVWHTAGAWV